jgi:hypothetical protein
VSTFVVPGTTAADRNDYGRERLLRDAMSTLVAVAFAQPVSPSSIAFLDGLIGALELQDAIVVPDSRSVSPTSSTLTFAEHLAHDQLDVLIVISTPCWRKTF